MSSIPHSKPNGTDVWHWRPEELGDAYEGEMPPAPTIEPSEPPSDDYQSYQRYQRLQTPLRRGSALSGASGSSDSSGPSGPSGSHEDISTRQRRAVFRLLRALKSTNRANFPTDTELRAFWEADKSLRGIPWDDFRLMALEGWGLVRQRVGEGPLAEALAEADRSPVPTVAERYEDPQRRRLVALCAVLQKRAGADPFFLAGTSVAEEFHVPQPRAARWLRLLVLDKVLVVVAKGRTGKASEYRFLGAQG